MFDCRWANIKGWQQECLLGGFSSEVNKRDIVAVMHLSWEMHCVECAMPDCYSVCSLYAGRPDGHCERSAYGIFPNKNFKGHFNFGADVKFRKWGKIEANLAQTYKVDTFPVFGKLVNINFLNKLRKTFVARNSFSGNPYDEFIVECFSSNEEPFKLIFEHFEQQKQFRKTKFRTNFLVKYGHNRLSIPYHSLTIDHSKGYIYLYPEDTTSEKRLIFTWLDFVKWRRPPTQHGDYKKDVMIKCVAWDLDNTLWAGTLIEDHRVVINPKSIELVKWLDERGVIQTILSKNDYASAWKAIEQFGLSQYFLHPEINWEPKSKNLKKIVDKLNIGLDSVAVIDDSVFERDEIMRHLTGVRVYSDKEIAFISQYREFKNVVSSDSRNRRLQYQVENSRSEALEEFDGSYEEFLKSCEMEVDAFIPVEKKHIDRCFELIQRSNQLNLSTIRYTREEFGRLLVDRKVLPIALHCKDRYGDYGIVGFSNLRIGNSVPVMENLVISCRVAQKMVEDTYLDRLCKLLKGSGYKQLFAGFVVTAKNGPLKKVFEKLPFKIHQQLSDRQILSIDLNEKFDIAKVLNFNLDPMIVKRLEPINN